MNFVGQMKTEYSPCNTFPEKLTTLLLRINTAF